MALAVQSESASARMADWDCCRALNAKAVTLLLFPASPEQRPDRDQVRLSPTAREAAHSRPGQAEFELQHRAFPSVVPRLLTALGRRAHHLSGSDVVVGVAELLEDGDTVAVAVQRDDDGCSSRTAAGALAGCGVAEAAQRACADRLNHWNITNTPNSKRITATATSLRLILPL